jgi:hypothetical protein
MDKGEPLDYGTIQVTFHKGLTWDQKASIVKMSIDNQLVTNSREHYNEIMNQCLDLIRMIGDVPFSINCKICEKYMYTFTVEFFDARGVSREP